MKATQELLTTDTKDLIVKVSQRGLHGKPYLEGHGIDAKTGRSIPGSSIRRALRAPESIPYITVTVSL